MLFWRLVSVFFLNMGGHKTWTSPASRGPYHQCLGSQGCSKVAVGKGRKRCSRKRWPRGNVSGWRDMVWHDYILLFNAVHPRNPTFLTGGLDFASCACVGKGWDAHHGSIVTDCALQVGESRGQKYATTIQNKSTPSGVTVLKDSGARTMIEQCIASGLGQHTIPSSTSSCLDKVNLWIWQTWWSLATDEWWQMLQKKGHTKEW